jgi:hypothetical protein
VKAFLKKGIAIIKATKGGINPKDFNTRPWLMISALGCRGIFQDFRSLSSRKPPPKTPPKKPMVFPNSLTPASMASSTVRTIVVLGKLIPRTSTPRTLKVLFSYSPLQARVTHGWVNNDADDAITCVPFLHPWFYYRIASSAHCVIKPGGFIKLPA